MAQQPLVDQGLITDVSRSHSDTPRSVGLLCTSGQLDAETSLPDKAQHSQETDIQPAVGFEPASQQAIGHRNTPLTARPLGSAFFKVQIKIISDFFPVKINYLSLYLQVYLSHWALSSLLEFLTSPLTATTSDPLTAAFFYP
jgi:hypothetical protein